MDACPPVGMWLTPATWRPLLIMGHAGHRQGYPTLTPHGVTPLPLWWHLLMQGCQGSWPTTLQTSAPWPLPCLGIVSPPANHPVSASLRRGQTSGREAGPAPFLPQPFWGQGHSSSRVEPGLPWDPQQQRGWQSNCSCSVPCPALMARPESARTNLTAAP